jgi:hypothetical protein
MCSLRGSRVAGLVLSLGCALLLCVPAAVAAEASEARADHAGSAAQNTPVAETEDEEALLERARAYWDLRAEASTGVYEFYPPEVRANGRLPAEFAGVYYKDYQIEYVVTDGDRGLVVVQTQQLLDPVLAARLEGRDNADHLRARIGEEWVRVEGSWYKKPNYGGLSRFMDPDRHSMASKKARPAEKAPQGTIGEPADGGRRAEKADQAAGKAKE